ncbi:UDP-galactopyranose mutase [Rariglobus hedericola]|uniref:UDP-galactopyranose mutase n=1 Tax=Rariglobus hedericola TaxID=2597822 RepID=A0A556QNH1_9BACT|nr:UDP-galactopyranose mutase [Rariglobus hedericola]TSJ78196.1 UDP-galactopyranose mutase [Rariglobus hedericola]
MSATYDYVIVGAGFSGLVLAERLGSIGKRCLVIEKRDHIGGNCYDRKDRHGLFYHVYGPHYFRTYSAQVRAYLSRFTEWNEVRYQVRVFTRGTYWSFPVNLETFRQLKAAPAATEDDFKQYLKDNALDIPSPANAKEAILSVAGRELYDLFYAGYTAKQWGRPPESLDASVTQRIPIRTNADDRYFQEDFQALPSEGYTRMFERLLAASGAELRLETDYRHALPGLTYGHLIYTGPIDEYFDCRWGPLPYRTLRFELDEVPAGPDGFAQPALQINYPGPEPFTRTVEVKHVTGQSSPWTNIVREFPGEYQAGQSEPYYPLPGAESRALAERYRMLAADEPNVTFVGRLAQYRYLNMDQIVAGALHTFEKLQER